MSNSAIERLGRVSDMNPKFVELLSNTSDWRVDFIRGDTKRGLQINFLQAAEDNPLNVPDEHSSFQSFSYTNIHLARAFGAVQWNNHQLVFPQNDFLQRIEGTLAPDFPHQHLHAWLERKGLEALLFRKANGFRSPTAVCPSAEGKEIVYCYQSEMRDLLEFVVGKAASLNDFLDDPELVKGAEENVAISQTALGMLEGHSMENLDKMNAALSSFVLDAVHNAVDFAAHLGRDGVESWCEQVEGEMDEAGILITPEWQEEEDQTLVVNATDLHWRQNTKEWQEKRQEQELASLNIYSYCRESIDET